MADTSKLNLPLIAAAQAQKHVTANETFNKLDVLVQLNVLDRNLTAPPSSPSEGDVYIPASTATGAWAGQENRIAAFQGGIWVFLIPSEGWIAWVRDEDRIYVYNGTAWTEFSPGVSNFLSLADTPGSFSGAGGRLLAVNSIGNAVEFIDANPISVEDIFDSVANPTSAGNPDPSNLALRANFYELNTDITLTRIEARYDNIDSVQHTLRAYILHTTTPPSPTGFVTITSVLKQSADVVIPANSNMLTVFDMEEFTINSNTVGHIAIALVRRNATNTTPARFYLTSTAGNSLGNWAAFRASGRTANNNPQATQSLQVISPAQAYNFTVKTLNPVIAEIPRNFIGQPDTPSLYTGNANRLLAVRDTANGVTFANGTSITDTVDGAVRGLKIARAIPVTPGPSVFQAMLEFAERQVNETEPSRARLGLTTNSANLQLDVSPDGTTFHEAFRVNANSGRVIFPNTIIQNGPRPWDVVERDHITNSPWTLHDAASNAQQWKALAWSSDLRLFAAVAGSGPNNRVMTSPDGVTWTNRASAADNDWQDIVWAHELNLFVACSLTGVSDRIMTSPDGINWTIRNSSGVNEGWTSIAWSPQLRLFAVVAETGTGLRVITSPNGIDWTARNNNIDSTWQSVVWADGLGRFVAVALGGTHKVMSSSDGINWSTNNVGPGLTPNQYNSVTWSPELELLVAVGEDNTSDQVMTSTDGFNWVNRTSPVGSWESVTWASEIGLFVAVSSGGTGNRIMTSPDGINWTARTSPADNFWIDVEWAPDLGLFAAVADFTGTQRVMTSVSGHTAPRKKARSGAFHAQGLVSSPTPPGTLIFNGVHGDNTNSYNTTTGQYTAPLPGWYFFKMQLLVNNNNADSVTFSVELRKNGIAFGSDNIIFAETLVANKYHSFSGSLVTDLNEGDVITAQLLQGGNIFTGDETYFQGFHIEGVQS